MVVGKVRIYALGSSGGVSFAAVNTDPSRAYELTLDASSSTNVRSHRNTLVATTTLPQADPAPKLLLVLLPVDRFEPWSYSYKVACYAPKARAVPPPQIKAAREELPPPAPPRVAAAPRQPPPASAPAKPPPPAVRAVAKARPANGAAAATATATLRPVE
jgi:hypothetical protein